MACRTSAPALGLLLALATMPARASSLQTFSFGNDEQVEFHLSGDGNWLVYSESSEDEPDWSSTLVGSGGTQPVDGEVTGISFDGSVLVGAGTDGYGFVLKNGVGTEIGDFTTNAAQPWQKGSSASAVSRDGKVVIGTAATDDGETAFRWTNGVLTDLGALPGGTDSNPTVLSADGSVIAGDSRVNGDSTAFVWSTSNPTVTALGSIGGPGSYANAISADGSTIVGRGDIGGPYIHAYRWTAGSGMVDLGALRWRQRQRGAGSVRRRHGGRRLGRERPGFRRGVPLDAGRRPRRARLARSQSAEPRLRHVG